MFPFWSKMSMGTDDKHSQWKQWATAGKCVLNFCAVSLLGYDGEDEKKKRRQFSESVESNEKKFFYSTKRKFWRIAHKSAAFYPERGKTGRR